ncbi:SDR family oxidoreductase [Enemella sp. A6]|uniref:SDR family oxidoreductase n=1 Tax=Enemella sp. A6 TaxID=3440152 RepID=UPI003EB7872E
MNEPATPPASPFRPDVLAGQVAVVTGGGTGIGKEICRMLGAHGASIAICSRKQEVLEATAAELRAEGITVHVDVCDVRDAEAVQRVMAGVVERFGRIDIVVNNAAGNFPAPITGISPNGFRTVVDIDLMGTYNVSKACFDAWLGEHGGVIVNISAPFELKGVAMQSHVAAAKAGVDSLTRTAAVEWGPYGIRVNAVAPGAIGATEGGRRFAESVPGPRPRRKNPLGMVGHGADIAAAVLFLATPAARFISGQVIAVDGAGSTDLLKLDLPDPTDRGVTE